MYTETDQLYNLISRADAGDLPDARTHSVADDFCQHYPVQHRTSLERKRAPANPPHTTAARGGQERTQ